MKKVAILLIITSSFVFAQNTYVPDDKFEQALIDLGYDTTLDDSVVTANISGVTNLDVSNKEISDLTGIEAFSALTNLNCEINKLTALDVSANTALNELHCPSNQLTSLDVSKNTALTYLHCSDNKLTSLDVSNNTALTHLYCGPNKLTSLDVSANTALIKLHCGENQLTSLDVSNNTALNDLWCADNKLTSLDVSANTALTHLDCVMNQLTSLDVSKNTALTWLHIANNQLTSLDVTSNTALLYLNPSNNQLTSLDVSKNTALTWLHIANNQLTSLDVSKNTALINVVFNFNQLTSLDVSNNTALTHLYCENNKLTSLDVSSNTALTVLHCSKNQLTYLNMKNGVTVQLNEFYATDNSNLTCIETLDPTWATANWTYENENIDDGVTFADICYASNPSYTYVPDDKFEQALIDLGYDTTLDDYVVTAKISSVTDLDVSNKEISDLTGIEAFSALTYLSCNSNQLTSLDVSKNTALTKLSCARNQLTGLDVSSNTALIWLFPWANQLTNIDVTNNTILTEFDVSSNQLTSLDVSKNTALIELSVSNNSLTGLDVSKNTALQNLRCLSNQLTSLDVSKNTALTYLDFSDNQLTSLDVRSNTALTELSCGENQLTSLDVSSNTALKVLHFRGNQLTSLDVSANTALTWLNCAINQLTSLDVSNNTALTGLHCYNNQLTSLDVSNNTALTNLWCDGNQLTSLDVNSNKALTNLQCGDNQLTSLDVNSNTALTVLICNVNQLTALDVSNNTALTHLNCVDNQLTYLNMRNGITDALTTFNATDNSNLTCIETLDPDYATANWISSNGNIDIDAGVTFSVICGGTDLTTWHVATTGSDAQGSGTEASPLATIQTGINAATESDTVSVAAGTYEEQVQFNSKNISLIGQDSSNTIIKWNGGIAVSLENGLTSHTPHIKNFTIKDGYSDTAGGILISNYGSPVLENLRIVNNTVIYNSDGNNDAGIGDGGGINIYNSSPTILNSYIAYNTAEKRGGGINVQNSTVTIKNTIIANNTATVRGGGIYNKHNITLTNVTISNNKATNDTGGGIYTTSGTLIVNNSIIWNNFQDEINGDATVTYSNIKGGYTGTGNIDGNPMFVDTANGDYHLKDWSPAIGAGTASGAPTTDIEGNPRPNPAGSNPDMGAFENKWGTPQNAPPVLSEIADVSVNEDESITVTLEAINADNADNDAITFSASSEKSEVKLSMGSSSGKVNISADENWNGLSKISVEATDGTAFDYGNFTVTFLPVNDKPIIASIASDTTNEETAKSIQVTASDIDGDELSISATTNNNHVVPSVSGMTLTLTPAKDFVGNTLVTVIVNDGSLTDTVSYQFTVLNVNDSPVLSAIKDQRIAEDTEFMVKVVATDVDDTSLSITGNTGSAGISVAFSGNDLTLKPEANWNGSSVITVYASDGKDMDSTKFNLTVDPMQDKPYNFDWVSTASTSIDITKSNLADTYELKWLESEDVDGETIDYLISASVGQFPAEMINETADTSMTITYQDIIDNWYPNLEMLSRATLKFSVSATDGIDTVNVTGDNRVLFVNRYEYLSTEGEGVPVEFALHENYPNPFNPTTTLRFDLPEVSDITLTIYNMLGQKVKTFNMQSTPAGYHSITWDATNDLNQQVGAGVYLYQLQTKDFVKTRKMVLLK